MVEAACGKNVMAESGVELAEGKRKKENFFVFFFFSFFCDKFFKNFNFFSIFFSLSFLFSFSVPFRFSFQVQGKRCGFFFN